VLFERTYDLVAQVPEGRVTTYGEVAKALGDIVARRQLDQKAHLNLEGLRGRIERVAGIDVAYEGEHAYSAMVIFDYKSVTNGRSCHSAGKPRI